MSDYDNRVFSLWPKPKCCAAIGRFPLVSAQVMTRIIEDGDVPRVAWAWCDYGYQFGYDEAFNPPPPTHCPFCQTPLPQLCKRDPAPEPLCMPGEDYCDTCGERLMGCACLPHQCAYEPADQEGNDT